MTLSVPYNRNAFVDAILDLAKNPEKLEKMQEREKEIAAEYDVKTIVEKWMILFAEGGSHVP